MVDENTVLDALRGVVDPAAIKGIRIDGERVFVDIVIDRPTSKMAEMQLKSECIKAVRNIDGVMGALVDLKVVGGPAPGHGGGPQGAPAGPPPDILPEVRFVVAVSSGKGGVGKSTVATNLALALAGKGLATGLLDADVYGPSAPTMFGVDGQPEATARQTILPIEKHGLKLMSMGFLSTDDTPIIWRGPMVHGLIQQFLRQVEWGALDYLIVDMPPGTGDAQLTLTQLCPLAGAIIVSTPQEVALIDARKGLRMFQRVNVPVLGLIENMSHFACPHCDEKTYIFRQDGGKKTAAELGIDFLGEIPIDPAIAVAGDEGLPIVARDPASPTARAFVALADTIVARLSGAAEEKGIGSLQW